MANALLGTLKRIKKDVRNALPKEHPFLDEKLVEEIVKACQRARDRLRKRRNKYQQLLERDDIREELGHILSGRVGEPYDTDRLVEICDIARKRYSARIPPGYADENKAQGNPFGDVIIWMQILDKAKIEKCHIIFVTDDRKEDWWIDDAAGELNPRQELVDEMQRKAGVMLHMYTPETFLEDFNVYFKKPKVREGVIEELAGLGAWETLKQAALQAQAQLSHTYQLPAVLDQMSTNLRALRNDQISAKQIQLSWPRAADAFRTLQTYLQSSTFPRTAPSWLKPYSPSAEEPPESGDQDVEPKNNGD